jgi:hypothetical protein
MCPAPAVGLSAGGADRVVPPRHDWDAFYAALTRRIHDHGVPATQAELVRDMLAWFEARDVEHAPDESTIRLKITACERTHGPSKRD